MSKPIPGTQYSVRAGDTLPSIAAMAYGDSTKWPVIDKANQSELKGGQLAVGQTLIIPELASIDKIKSEQAQVQLGSREKDQLTIIIGGNEVLAKEAIVSTAIDAVADGFSVVIEWEPGRDINLDKALLPYSYADASVFIGTEQLINGAVYLIGSALSSETHQKAIGGFHRTVDIVDSDMTPPYEQSSITLQDRAQELLGPLGINVIFDADQDEIFDRVIAKTTDKIFGHLASLASQRGLLITSTPQGDVLFTEAAEAPIVGTLSEGDSRVLTWQAQYDGRLRFNAYRGISQSAGFNDIGAVAIDNNVPKTRFKTFSVQDATNGNIQQAVDWRRNKDVADSLTLSLPVSGWFAPDGSLWKKNTLVTVQSATVHVPQGFTFLIRRVEFQLSSTKGQTATLDLVPPQFYTREQLMEPWA